MGSRLQWYRQSSTVREKEPRAAPYPVRGGPVTTVSWSENGSTSSASWRSENGAPPPERIVVVRDDIAADTALRLVRSGTGVLWKGDFQNARQLLRALDRRLSKAAARTPPVADAARAFHDQRRARERRAAVLGRILIPLERDHSVNLRRAPDVREACTHAYGLPPTGHRPGPEQTVLSLPELLGVVSAYQWHQRGIEIAALGARIHPAYGVFAPTRGEYVDLVAGAPMPLGADRPVVMDIGTGTGVLAAIMVRRGAHEVHATDSNPRAVACARDNLDRLGMTARVTVSAADLWPETARRADVVVCNPPWIPGRPTSALETGIYDAGSEMLHRFLTELPEHLSPGGEGWLILSDLAEHLGLRTRAELHQRIAAAGLTVTGTHHTAPRHPRASDTADPVHIARSREETTLWRLTARASPDRVL